MEAVAHRSDLAELISDPYNIMYLLLVCFLGSKRIMCDTSWQRRRSAANQDASAFRADACGRLGHEFSGTHHNHISRPFWRHFPKAFYVYSFIVLNECRDWRQDPYSQAFVLFWQLGERFREALLVRQIWFALQILHKITLYMKLQIIYHRNLTTYFLNQNISLLTRHNVSKYKRYILTSLLWLVYNT